MSATLAALSLITLSIFVILIPIVYIVTVAIRQGLELSNDTHGEEKRANTLNRTGTETTAFGMDSVGQSDCECRSYSSTD